MCVCVGQSVPSGVIHCEPTVWCIWETPLCFQKGIFHFAAKHFRKVPIAPVFFLGGGFLYLPGLLRFLDTSGHLQRGSGGVVLLQGKPGGHSCSVLSCSGGILTRVGVCFLPSLLPVIVSKLVTWHPAFSMKRLPVVSTPLLSVTIQSNTMELDHDPDWCKHNGVL